jgi:hypothetical protein
MANIDELIAAISGSNAKTQAQIDAADPYGNMSKLGDAALGEVLKYQGGSPTEKIVGAALAGLGGGVFTGLSNDYKGRANSAYQQAVMDSIHGLPVTDSGVLSPQLFADAGNQANIFKLRNSLDAQAARQKLDQDITLETVKAGLQGDASTRAAIAKAIGDNPRQAEAIKKAFGLPVNSIADAAAPIVKGVDSEGVAMPYGMEQPIVKPEASADKETQSIFSGKTVKDKLKTNLQEFIDAGASPSAAADLASKSSGADLIQNKIAAAKVDDIRKQVSSLEDVINTAKLGMSGAGETGGSFGTARDILSKLAASTYSDDQKTKQAAQTQLDSVKPKIISANRYPGAVSDTDVRMLVGAGPSSDKTPQANALIVRNMDILKGRMGDYADFMDQYLAEKGDLQGAEQLWKKYNSANPLVVTKDGKSYVNDQAQNWQEFFSGAKSEGAQKASKTSASPATPPTYTASQLLAQGYVKTAQGWVKQ